MRLTIAILIATLPLSANGQAVRLVDPHIIDQAVADFTGASIGQPGGARAATDQRLRLAACDGPLALAWHGSRRDMVRVECVDARSWKLFVPVASAATAAGNPVIQRGQPLTLTLEGRGFSISQQGEALDSGRPGEWIRVRPAGKKDALRALVQPDGRVTIPLG